MSETACPVFPIKILLWHRSKCASHTASAGVVPHPREQQTTEVKAASSSCTTELSLSSSECDQKSNIFFFFYDAPIPHTESYFNIIATPLWSPLCCDRSAPIPWASVRKSAEMQPLRSQKWNEQIHLVISPISSKHLSIRLKTLPLKPS